MKKKLIILFLFAVVLACTAGRGDNPKSRIEDYRVGETVYACGCPMMCCNSISKTPKGRCDCNFPLKKGTVSRIQDGRVYVEFSGREKSFFITNR